MAPGCNLKLLWLLLAGSLAACSAIMPTRDIPSQDAQGSYPQIGAVPEGETKTLSEEEREKMKADLDAARDKNKKAAATPIPEQVQ